MVMREYFIELFKKARTASPTEKLQIEADLALIVKELLKPFWGTTGVRSNGAPLCHARRIMTIAEVVHRERLTITEALARRDLSDQTSTIVVGLKSRSDYIVTEGCRLYDIISRENWRAESSRGSNIFELGGSSAGLP